MSVPPTPRRSGAVKLLAGRIIVVVDDDESLRTLTCSYLQRAGATVHLAANGRDALTLMQTLHTDGTDIHAVLCDLRMRGGSGIELHQRMGELLPSILPRMIFSSGDVESDDVRSFIKSGNVTVLAKPYQLSQLKRLLADMPLSS